MSDIPIKNIYDLSVYDLPLTTYDYVVGTHGNNEAVRIPATNLTSVKEISFSDIPTSPTSTGTDGNIACDSDYMYTYMGGFWARTPRDTSWTATYFRIDDGASITEAQKSKIYSQLDLKEATTSSLGLVQYAEKSELVASDAHLVTTPDYVSWYVAHNPVFELTSAYIATDETKAVSGKAVHSAITGLNIPEVTSTYTPTDTDKALNGVAVTSAIKATMPTVTNVYNPTDTTSAVTGMAVNSALGTLTIPELTSTYTATDTTKATTGKAVATAVKAVADTIPTVVSTYSATGTDAINGIGVKAALDTIKGIEVTSDYLPGDTAKAITGKGVSLALATITFPTVDQTYNSASTNAQSGVAIETQFENVRASIPTAATSYVTTDTEKYITGKVLATALSDYTPTVVDIYNPEGTAAISGKGVASAITSEYDKTNTVKAVTGYAVHIAIAEEVGTIVVPEKATSYTYNQDTYYATCKTIDQALNTYRTTAYTSSDGTKLATGMSIYNGIKDETLSTYNSTSTMPISGKGVAAAITSTYTSTDTVQAVTGKAVHDALGEYDEVVDEKISTVTAIIPTKADEYDSTDNTKYVTGVVVAEALAGVGGVVDQEYDATSENAQSGTAVAQAIASVTTGTTSVELNTENILDNLLYY